MAYGDLMWYPTFPEISTWFPHIPCHLPRCVVAPPASPKTKTGKILHLYCWRKPCDNHTRHTRCFLLWWHLKRTNMEKSTRKARIRLRGCAKLYSCPRITHLPCTAQVSFKKAETETLSTPFANVQTGRSHFSWNSAGAWGPCAATSSKLQDFSSTYYLRGGDFVKGMAHGLQSCTKLHCQLPRSFEVKTLQLRILMVLMTFMRIHYIIHYGSLDSVRIPCCRFPITIDVRRHPAPASKNSPRA